MWILLVSALSRKYDLVYDTIVTEDGEFSGERIEDVLAHVHTFTVRDKHLVDIVVRGKAKGYAPNVVSRSVWVWPGLGRRTPDVDAHLLQRWSGSASSVTPNIIATMLTSSSGGDSPSPRRFFLGADLHDSLQWISATLCNTPRRGASAHDTASTDHDDFRVSKPALCFGTTAEPQQIASMEELKVLFGGRAHAATFDMPRLEALVPAEGDKDKRGRERAARIGAGADDLGFKTSGVVLHLVSVENGTPVLLQLLYDYQGSRGAAALFCRLDLESMLSNGHLCDAIKMCSTLMAPAALRSLLHPTGEELNYSNLMVSIREAPLYFGCDCTGTSSRKCVRCRASAICFYVSHK